MCEESIAAAPTDLTETGAEERGQYAPGGQLWQPPHGSRSDDDFNSDQRLLRRLAPLAAERVNIELKRIPPPRDSLSPRPSVHVTARDLRHRGDETTIRFALDRDNVAKLRRAGPSVTHA